MMVATHTTLGARVAALRHRAGLSQGELAGRTGVDEHELAAIEHGERGLAVAEVDALAGALAVPVDAVLTGQESVTPLFRNEGGSDEADAAVIELNSVIDDFFTFAAAVRR